MQDIVDKNGFDKDEFNDKHNDKKRICPLFPHYKYLLERIIITLKLTIILIFYETPLFSH